MAIIEQPTKLRDYYKLMIEAAKAKSESCNFELEQCIEDVEKLHKYISAISVSYLDFKIDLAKYEEFVNNSYIDGTFLRVAKGAYLNRSNNYELVSDLYDLYKLARLQKHIVDIKASIGLINKMLNLSFKEYSSIMKTYYTEVHKQLILNGYGYVFGQSIGWICINRVILKHVKPHIDYKATKEREKELIKQGARIYNKEEAEWCRKRGIEYKAEDKRVFQNIEYCYEIPLMDSKLPNGTKLKLEIADYRYSKLRGKSNDILAEECNNDIEKICELPVDLKTKLSICDKINKILYTKYIRNENQESFTTTKVARKNRQRL